MQGGERPQSLHNIVQLDGEERVSAVRETGEEYQRKGALSFEKADC